MSAELVGDESVLSTSLSNTESLRLLNAFASAMLDARDLDDLLRAITSMTGQLQGFDDCVLYLRRGDVLVQAAAFSVKGSAERVILDPLEIPIGVGVVGAVAASGVWEVVQHASAEPRKTSEPSDPVPGGSKLTVPITYQGRVVAVLDSESLEPGRFGSVEAEFVQRVADMAAPFIALAHAESERAGAARPTVEALRRAEFSQRALRSALPDMMMRFSRAGEYLEYHPANDAACPPAVPAEKIVGLTVYDALDPQQAADAVIAIGKAIDTGRTEVFEYQVRVEGRVRHREARFTVNGPDEVVAIIRDFTERVEAEQRYRTLFEDSPMAVLVLDPDARTVVDCNGRAEQLTGFTRADLLGVTRPRATDGGGDVVEQLLDEIELAERRTFETVIVGMDGQERQILAHLSRMDAQRRPLVQLIAQDVTQARRAAQQLSHKQRIEAVGRLAGGVAHDFNNLLTVIQGVADLALADAAEDEVMAGNLRSILGAADRAAALTQQLLAFSRKQIVEPTVFDLNEVVSAVEAMLRRVISEDIQFASVLAPGRLAIRADRGQIEQVLTNLVVNARDAMPDGGRVKLATGRRSLDAREGRDDPDFTPGDFVFLSIRDDGHGMNESVRKHIFEPFFTTKPEGEGTGLGLSTAYGIVKEAGGFIQVESGPNDGSRFTVYLPAEQEAVPGEGPRRPLGAVAVGDEAILLVEDNEGVRRTMQMMLERLGYTVHPVGSGAEAVTFLLDHEAPIHLLLTDVVLPGMGGAEVAERVTAMRPGLPVLFASGYTDDVIFRRRLIDRDVVLLRKPIGIHELAQKVREMLDGGPAGDQKGG